MYRWSDIRGAFKRVTSSPRRYPLTTQSLVALFAFLGLTSFSLYFLITSSYEKERSIREDLYSRDLKDIIDRFDADERFVLANNFSQFVSEQRQLRPLLLPRHYYTAFPIRPSSGAPRPPPNNCFVDLYLDSVMAEVVGGEKQDRFCAYFALERSAGAYLYFVYTFTDYDLVVHRVGDSTLNADALQLSVEYKGLKGTWILLLQQGRVVKAPDRFPVTAYQEVRGRPERDKRFDGWAYQRPKDAKAALVTILARVDFKAIDPSHAAAGEWPPDDFQRMQFHLSRRNASPSRKVAAFTPYADFGLANMSVQSLTSGFGSARGRFLVRQMQISGEIDTWLVTPFGVERGDSGHKEPWIRLVDGDLVFSGQNPMRRTSVMPDTNITLEMIHPGFVIEKGIWQTVLLLILFLSVFLWWAVGFVRKTLFPINRMAKHAKTLASAAPDVRNILPYEEQRNEIGALATAFNELLARTREQARREQEDRAKREEETRRRELDEIQARETNLRTIGHEIRAPLQALMAILAPEHKGRRYVDKMIRAVTQLFGASGPEAGFAAMQLQPERADIAAFLSEVAANSHIAGIENVEYIGPGAGLFAFLDISALEDAIAHILDNARRLRVHGTTIRIRLEQTASAIYIAIANEGRNIPPDMLERIFEFNVSLDPDPAPGPLGQGLFVARSYLRKMGGEIVAKNLQGGVEFQIQLP